MEITLLHYLILSTILFLIGIFGLFLNSKNLISIIMSIEVIFLAVNINFITFATFWNDFKGQFFVLFILTVSASEIAIALVALVLHLKNHNIAINVDDLNTLRG
jgi:NADH-quinone oxidoreductase subunit K